MKVYLLIEYFNSSDCDNDVITSIIEIFSSKSKALKYLEKSPHIEYLYTENPQGELGICVGIEEWEVKWKEKMY